MKIDPAFLSAAANRRIEKGPVIYRLALRPVTLGHLFVLHELKSPLLYELEDDIGQVLVDEIEFILAAMILSLRPNTASKAIRSRWLGLVVRLWGWAACRKLDLNANQAALISWFSECMSMPRNTVPTGNGYECKELGAPQCYRLLSILMSVFHMSEDAAMEMPVQHANCLYLAWAEWENRVELSSSPLLDLVAFAKEQDSKLYDSSGNRLPNYHEEMRRRRNLASSEMN